MNQTMKFIVDKISAMEGSITTSTINEDGRVNSIHDEDSIIDMMISIFGEDNIKKQRPRHWFDVLFFGIPLQIKSSSFSNNAADNFSAKKALLWAFTNMTESDIDRAKVSWKKFDNLLLSNLDENTSRDYYILVFNKDESTFHVHSLKTLETLTSNGSNLPFQINWKINRKVVNRNFTEAKKFVLSAYKSSIERAVNRHQGILNYDI